MGWMVSVEMNAFNLKLIKEMLIHMYSVMQTKSIREQPCSELKKVEDSARLPNLKRWYWTNWKLNNELSYTLHL